MYKKVLKIGLCTVVAVVGSELVWRYICLWKRRVKKIIKAIKIEENDEVHFSNKFSVSVGCDLIRPINGKHVCDNEFCGIKNIESIIEIINNAKSSIDIAMYMFYCQDFLLPLLRAITRGVSIRIIGSKNEVYKDDSIILRLCSNGVPVRFHYRSRKLMHHKFCIIDANESDDEDDNEDEKRISRVLFLGSQNWTQQSFYVNCENFIITSNIKLIKKYRTEFDRLWDALDPESETNKMPTDGSIFKHWNY